MTKPKLDWDTINEDNLMEERGSDYINYKIPAENLPVDASPEYQDYIDTTRRKSVLLAQAEWGSPALFRDFRDRKGFPDCTKGMVVQTDCFIGRVVDVFDEGRKIKIIDAGGKLRTLNVAALLQAD